MAEGERPSVIRIALFLSLTLFLLMIFLIAYYGLLWYEYCFFKFGPILVDDRSMLGFANDNSIDLLHHDACDHDSSSSHHIDHNELDAFCPDLCDNLDDIKTAMQGTNAMAAFYFITVIAYMWVLFCLLMPVKTRKVMWFILYHILVTLLFAWPLLALITYSGGGGWDQFDSTHNSPHNYKLYNADGKHKEPKDVNYEAGFPLAVTFLIIQGAASVGQIVGAIPFWSTFDS